MLGLRSHTVHTNSLHVLFHSSHCSSSTSSLPRKYSVSLLNWNTLISTRPNLSGFTSEHPSDVLNPWSCPSPSRCQRESQHFHVCSASSSASCSFPPCLSTTLNSWSHALHCSGLLTPTNTSKTVWLSLSPTLATPPLPLGPRLPANQRRTYTKDHRDVPGGDIVACITLPYSVSDLLRWLWAWEISNAPWF